MKLACCCLQSWDTPQGTWWGSQVTPPDHPDEGRAVQSTRIIWGELEVREEVSPAGGKAMDCGEKHSPEWGSWLCPSTTPDRGPRTSGVPLLLGYGVSVGRGHHGSAWLLLSM